MDELKPTAEQRGDIYGMMEEQEELHAITKLPLRPFYSSTELQDIVSNLNKSIAEARLKINELIEHHNQEHH